MAVSCGVVRRWWHRRLRRIDKQILFPAIEEQARRYADREERARKIQQAFALFRIQPGQEHWRCGCAKEEW